MELGCLIVLLIFVPLFIREIIIDPPPKWEGSGVPRHGSSAPSGDTGTDMSQAAMFMNMDE